MRSIVLSLLAGAACTSAGSPKPTVATWPVPSGWKSEVIPFPLEFAPSLVHRGIEELRFPPGFLDEGAPNRWSYAFVWRLDDDALLDATQLGDELTAYFRGLLISVDGDKHRVPPDAIVAHATAAADGFALSAHVIDTFRSAGPVDLVGAARRIPCGTGALWTFVLAPQGSPVRAELDALVAGAACRR